MRAPSFSPLPPSESIVTLLAEQAARLNEDEEQTCACEKSGQHRVGDKGNDAAESKHAECQLDRVADERKRKDNFDEIGAPGGGDRYASREERNLVLLVL